MERYFYIVATLAFTAYGQIVLKHRVVAHLPGVGKSTRLSYIVGMLTDVAVLSALAAGALAAICWMLALQKLSLSFAYPFMALSFVLVPLTAWWLLGEKLGAGQMIGAILIVAGVALSTFAQIGSAAQ